MSRTALLIGVPGGGVNVSLAARRLTPVLERLGFDSILTCSGAKATRAGILAALERLERGCERGDAVLIHYFGHGGRVRFTDLMPEQVFGYITTTQATRGAGFEALLDVELSARFSQLERRCGNLTVMLDCCYSAELVRSGGSRGRRAADSRPAEDGDVSLSTTREQAAPDWARATLTAERGHALALDSHPGIVRLCGASAKREAFAAVRGGRHIGRMTEAFIAALDAAGDDWAELYWEGLGHYLREHVVEALAMEGQWVALAGPVERRLFSTQIVDAPGGVSFVVAEQPGCGWLRAGWHQGLSVGDRWLVLEPRVGLAERSPRPLVELEVTKVGRNRADVRFDAAALDGRELQAGLPATPLRLAERIRVQLEQAPAQLLEALASSAWIETESESETETETETTESDALSLRFEGDAAWLRCGEQPALRVSGCEQPALVEQLEQLARVCVLERNFAAREASECPLSWGWSLADELDAALPHTGARLHVGDRVCVEFGIDAQADPYNWFVSVVLVEPGGRLRLLSTRMPEGIEVSPGERERVGWRIARAGPQGIALSWPEGVELGPEHSTAPARIMLLASRRPIELGHIVRAQSRDGDAALAVQGLADETLRGRKPEHSRGCSWASFEFELSPTPRPSPMHQ